MELSSNVCIVFFPWLPTIMFISRNVPYFVEMRMKPQSIQWLQHVCSVHLMRSAFDGGLILAAKLDCSMYRMQINFDGKPMWSIWIVGLIWPNNNNTSTSNTSARNKSNLNTVERKKRSKPMENGMPLTSLPRMWQWNLFTTLITIRRTAAFQSITWENAEDAKSAELKKKYSWAQCSNSRFAFIERKPSNWARKLAFSRVFRLAAYQFHWKIS